jgi:hypothetical protein
MKIVVNDDVMIKLLAIANKTAPQEFSGQGYVKIEGDTARMYDFVLANIGSTTYTEIPTEHLMELMERPDAKSMKVWLHRHPVGNGIPGQHNWSGTDEATIQEAPLGGIPEMVKWSISIVLTPKGWVGRIDNHLKKTVQHLEVFPALADVYQDVAGIKRIKAVDDTVIDWSGTSGLSARAYTNNDLTDDQYYAALIGILNNTPDIDLVSVGRTRHEVNLIIRAKDLATIEQIVIDLEETKDPDEKLVENLQNTSDDILASVGYAREEVDEAIETCDTNSMQYIWDAVLEEGDDSQQWSDTFGGRQQYLSMDFAQIQSQLRTQAAHHPETQYFRRM